MDNNKIIKLKHDFQSKTEKLRTQIDNKKAKIEQEQATLRKHQKNYDDQKKAYENDVNALMTQLMLKENCSQEQAKKIYDDLMNLDTPAEPRGYKHSEADVSDDVEASSHSYNQNY